MSGRRETNRNEQRRARKLARALGIPYAQALADIRAEAAAAAVVPIPQSVVFRGGPADGERARPKPAERVCAFKAEDADYARTSEEFTDERGRRCVVFAHDPDGRLMEAAGFRYAGPTGGLRLWWRRLHRSPKVIALRGGPADGQLRHHPPDEFPDGLFRIERDGAAYGRTTNEFVDAEGKRHAVFQHDPTGAITEHARRLYQGPPAPPL